MELKTTSGTLPKENKAMTLNTIAEAIQDIKAGKVIIVVDDEDRENEGDFICSAETITPEIINFMATHGRGLICTPIEETLADDLDLPMMVQKNTALHETAFTVSVDLIGNGCSTGISAYDRATGIKAFVNPNTKATDFARPGHIFPLRAKSGGVLRRTGHTEAAIDLARLAGYAPVGVLVEILNEDGSMARLPQLVKIAKKHDLKIISINDLVAYRMQNERLIKKEMSVSIDTKYGSFEIIAYQQITTGDIHLAIKKGNWVIGDKVLVRVHSSTETIDVLGSLFGDRQGFLDKALRQISKSGNGLLLYMRHGEKDFCLVDYLKMHSEQSDSSLNEMKKVLNQKDFGVGAQILADLGCNKIQLITNNPKRRVGLEGYGLEIVDFVKLDN